MGDSVVGVEPAGAAAGVNARRPTTATAPTRAAGATTRARSTLRIRGPIYFSRNRQLKMPIHMKSTKCQ